MSMTEYETVWSGATWRTYPQPEIAQREARILTPDDRMRQGEGRALVAACIAKGGWCSVKTIRRRTGLSDRQVRTHLRIGAEKGRWVRAEVPSPKKGLSPLYLYGTHETAATIPATREAA